MKRLIVTLIAASGCVAEAPERTLIDPSTPVATPTAPMAPAAPRAPMSPGPTAPMGPGPTVPPRSPDDPPCAEDLAFFETDVFAPVLAVRCLGCHNASGPAAHTRLVLDLDDAVASFRSVETVALERVGATPLLLAKPSGQHPQGHAGGQLFDPSSHDYAALAAFVERVADPACDEPVEPEPECGEADPRPRQLRRLSHAEYDRTIQSLLGIDSAWGRQFAADPEVHGFENHAPSLSVSRLLADQLAEAAGALAAEAMRSRRQQLVPCEPNPDPEGCARDVIRTLGRRAFRRPITADDVTRYMTVYRAAVSFDEGVQLMIEAMLQSPSFLYRLELGRATAPGTFTLTDHEVATQLAYLLTGTTPDDALLDAADAGLLSTPTQIEAQARRLLPRARPMLHDLVERWLGLHRLPSTPKDAATYPELDDDLRAAMIDGGRALVDDILDSGGGLTELLTTPRVMVDARLAPLYGAQASDWSPVEDPRLAGLLTSAAVLTTHALPRGSSPVHRGLLIRERVLCQELPPPPGVNAEPPALDPALSTRERYRAHGEVEPCVSCHRLIDPIGFAFEHFDGIGRLRSDDSGHPIDARGEIVQSRTTDGSFDGVAELGRHLAGSGDVTRCVSAQAVRWGYGIDEDASSCLVREISNAFEAGDRKLDALLLALASSLHVTTRTGTTTDEPAEPEPPAPPPPPPPPTMAVDVEVQTDSDWGAGWCATVEVASASTAVIQWRVNLRIEGTITTHWNAERSADSGDVTFSGVEWNADLAPSSAVSFGFCAQR